jgi:hypothetical protein
MIYVDDLRVYNLKRSKWCHMATDGDLNELHDFAAAIGLKRHYFQGGRLPHYDLVDSKRILAVRMGAKEVEATELIRLCFPKRQI